MKQSGTSWREEIRLIYEAATSWPAIVAMLTFLVGTLFKFNADALIGLSLWACFVVPLPWLDFTLTSLLSNLPVLILIGIFLNYSESRKVSRAITERLLLIFGGAEKKEIFRQLPDDYQQSIVRGSLESTLGQEYGSVLYSEIVSSYLKQERHYRKDLNYAITCHDRRVQEINVNAPSLKSLISGLASDYIWVEQDLGYTRHGFKSNDSFDSLYAVIALDQEQLNALMTDPSPQIFFREILRVHDDVKERILLLGSSELDELVRIVFNLRVAPLGTTSELKYSVRWAELSKKKYIEIKINDANSRLEASGCRLQFMLPHNKSDRQFLVFLPHPIHSNATISFKRSASMQSLTKIPFLSEFKPGTYKVSSTGRRRT